MIRLAGLSKRGVLSKQLLFTNRYPVTAPKDERFLRFYDFDASYLSQTPYLLKPFEPGIHAIRDSILHINSLVGLPWWSVLAITALISRIIIFPLILVQLKRFSKIGPIAPVLVFLKEAWGYSELGFWQKLKHSVRVYRELAKQEKFRFSTIYVYNLAYYPLLISMILGVRQILGTPEAKGASFLYITDFTDMDPYFILPTLTIGLYYYNFQRFITRQNEKTLMTKVRRICQALLIIWYPFLCSWPAGITLYMTCNALVSVLQSTMMKSRWWTQKMNQKIVLYNSVLQTVEYDKGTSQGIIQAIRKGEENFDSQAIEEAVIEKQTAEMLSNLEKDEELKEDIEQLSKGKQQ